MCADCVESTFTELAYQFVSVRADNRGSLVRTASSSSSKSCTLRRREKFQNFAVVPLERAHHFQTVATSAMSTSMKRALDSTNTNTDAGDTTDADDHAKKAKKADCPCKTTEALASLQDLVRYLSQFTQEDMSSTVYTDRCSRNRQFWYV